MNIPETEEEKGKESIFIVMGLSQYVFGVGFANFLGTHGRLMPVS